MTIHVALGCIPLHVIPFDRKTGATRPLSFRLHDPLLIDVQSVFDVLPQCILKKGVVRWWSPEQGTGGVSWSCYVP